jgi:hypothetical protein
MTYLPLERMTNEESLSLLLQRLSYEWLRTELSWMELTSRWPEHRSRPRTVLVILCFLCHEKCLPNRYPATDYSVSIRYSKNVFGEPLASNGLPVWLHNSGFQTVFTEPLPNNGHIRHNIKASQMICSLVVLLKTKFSLHLSVSSFLLHALSI